MAPVIWMVDHKPLSSKLVIVGTNRNNSKVGPDHKLWVPIRRYFDTFAISVSWKILSRSDTASKRMVVQPKEIIGVWFIVNNASVMRMNAKDPPSSRLIFELPEYKVLSYFDYVHKLGK